MIIDFKVCCNCYKEKILDFFGFWKYCCPACSAKNSLTRHAVYERNICYLDDSEFICTRITILRLICASCGTTHAVLPSDTIPFCYYSVTCVIKFLSEFLIEKNSIPTIADKFNIVESTVRIYLLKYLLSLISCIVFLRVFLLIQLDNKASPTEVLKIIKSSFSIETFQKEYFIHTRQLFLMTRRRNILSNSLHIGI